MKIDYDDKPHESNKTGVLHARCPQCYADYKVIADVINLTGITCRNCLIDLTPRYVET